MLDAPQDDLAQVIGGDLTRSKVLARLDDVELEVILQDESAITRTIVLDIGLAGEPDRVLAVWGDHLVHLTIQLILRWCRLRRSKANRKATTGVPCQPEDTSCLEGILQGTNATVQRIALVAKTLVAGSLWLNAWDVRVAPSAGLLEALASGAVARPTEVSVTSVSDALVRVVLGVAVVVVLVGHCLESEQVVFLFNLV
jgi:hypothetical protein